MADDRAGKENWRHWGPHVSERQWGTVREDYSPSGNAWEYFPHDRARSRAYRWGEDGIAGFSDDCLSKGGMRMLTRTAGVELAPHNILVVGVGPGAVATPINTSTMADPVLLQKLNRAIPPGRMANPEEIAGLVAFLAGDAASYLTETTVFSDGGLMQSSPGL
jgi:NAD(P)-dependent dehydrogenase (short-subunit alcohol dehydrogenase family)